MTARTAPVHFGHIFTTPFGRRRSSASAGSRSRPQSMHTSRSRGGRPSRFPTGPLSRVAAGPATDLDPIEGAGTGLVRRRPQVGAGPAATRDNGPVGNLEGRPPRERLVCIDCGLDLDPAEALERRRPNGVVKMCPKCTGAVRAVMDNLLGYGPINRLPKDEEP